MKILHFLWSLDNGGAENLAIDLANDQCGAHDVTVLVANNLVDAAVRSRLNASVRFIHLGRPAGSKNPYWFFRLIAVIRSLAPDIVHSHSGNFADIGRFLSPPLVLTVHGNDVKLPSSASRFSAVCCISQAVHADISCRYPHLNTRLINNGVRASMIASKRQNVLPSTPVRLVQISRLRHATKGQDLLIEAVSIMNGNHTDPVVCVDFVGDGPSLSYLMELAATKGVERSCRFLGARPREDVYATLRDYDILVQPSRDEGFGLTVAEGMAAGVSVVVSNLKGPMQVIDGGRYGRFFSSGDPISLATTLAGAIKDLGTDTEIARIAAARRHIADHYDLAVSSDTYVRLYRELVTA